MCPFWARFFCYPLPILRKLGGDGDMMRFKKRCCLYLVFIRSCWLLFFIPIMAWKYCSGFSIYAFAKLWKKLGGGDWCVHMICVYELVWACLTLFSMCRNHHLEWSLILSLLLYVLMWSSIFWIFTPTHVVSYFNQNLRKGEICSFWLAPFGKATRVVQDLF